MGVYIYGGGSNALTQKLCKANQAPTLTAIPSVAITNLHARRVLCGKWLFVHGLL